MNNEEFTVIFYTKDNGKVPVAEFLDNLDKAIRAEITLEIKLLKEHGFNLREPHVKFIRDGLYELRIKVVRNHYRILYFFAKDKNIIMTNGFIKKDNKTPPKEIQTALDYKNNYEAKFKE